ncbi:MAG: phosphoenolpyruvate--protein phosphotransferase [Treponema sp.]|jgi:phosphotransferase system enzyme I (PtsI)|nr:phosphoenolpyruvate--protein phosphotransferase [Treponema sp.]
MMKQFTGIPASPGITMGKAFLYIEKELPETKRRHLENCEIEAELKRFHSALGSALEELEFLQKKAEKEMQREQAGIFSAHLMMLEDPDFTDMINAKIKAEANSEWAVWETRRELTEKMLSCGDAALRERAADITDVSKRVVYHLLPEKRETLADLDEDVILAARDLLPSEALSMNKTHVKGIVLDMGSSTCHTAILARAFNIPAVLGLSNASGEILSGDVLIVDGNSGQVIVNPENNTLDNYRKAESLHHEKQAEDLQAAGLPAVTLDNCRVALKANIGTPDEAAGALRFGAEGIGLYRSEFLFLAKEGETGEEAQIEAYSKVFKIMGQLPVTVRTVDLGGDKMLSGFDSKHDTNPLLGWRGIRFSLARPELFKTQLRAILRASVNGNARIMFPLVSGIEELEQALTLLDEARAECKNKSHAFSENIETGIMIEVPSAAITADILAEKSAFFSIGTNDLLQYSLAVDRGNERVNYLAQPGHPAVVRLLKNTIDAAHKKGIKAAMCGEMAGDPLFTPLLLGLGLDEFSMSASSIPKVKKIIRGVSMEACKALAADILKSSSYNENTTLLKNWIKGNTPA